MLGLGMLFVWGMGIPFYVWTHRRGSHFHLFDSNKTICEFLCTFLKIEDELYVIHFCANPCTVTGTINTSRLCYFQFLLLVTNEVRF